MIRFKQSATFRKWHRKLKDGQAKAMIAMRLHRLASGHSGDAASVGGGVSKLRIHYGPGYRVYFQQRSDMFILLLCGGDKNTQDRDIRTAQRIAAQWSDDDG